MIDGVNLDAEATLGRLETDAFIIDLRSTCLQNHSLPMNAALVL